MREVLDAMKPAKISFSAQGVREGYLYSLLSEDERRMDPLLAAADELAILRARSPEHARELAEQNPLESKRLSPAAMELLTGYDWPGNVKQLQGVIEQGFFKAQS